MAIAYDNSTFKSQTATTVTLTHTVNSNTNGILFACLQNNDNNTDIFTGTVSYNGVSMTRLTGTAGSNGQSNLYTVIYFLLAPATGANTLSVTASASHAINFGCTSYTGVAQSTPSLTTLAPGVNGAGSTTATLNIATANSWMYAFEAQDGILPTASTGVTNTRASETPVAYRQQGDSGVIASTGNYSMTWTAATNCTSIGAVAFAPAGGAASNTGGFFAAAI